MPTGVTINATTGRLSGFPRQLGDFSYQAQVASCGTASQTFTLSVTAPTLATADVTAQLLGPTAPLTADQVRYLDFLGNNNASFDIGDFLAWLKPRGAAHGRSGALSRLPRHNNDSFDIGDFLAWVKVTRPPLSAAALQAIQQKGGPR